MEATKDRVVVGLIEAVKAVLVEFDRCTMFDANGSPFEVLRERIREVEDTK